MTEFVSTCDFVVHPVSRSPPFGSPPLLSRLALEFKLVRKRFGVLAVARGYGSEQSSHLRRETPTTAAANRPG